MPAARRTGAVKALPAFTDRQLVFIGKYVQTRHVTRSAIAAGCPADSASVQGSRWLADPRIRTEVDKRLKRMLERYEVTPAKIVAELAKIAYSNVDDYVSVQDDGSVIVDFSTATREEMAALSQIEVHEYTEGRGENAANVKVVKFKAIDKRAALMDLAKIRRMLPADRIEHTGADGAPLMPERVIDVRKLSHEEREQLRLILLGTKRPEVTDVEDTSDVDDET